MNTAKPTQLTVLENSKNSYNNYPKSLKSISDINKLYRREQTYRKKLKMLMETNSLLQARIKIYESSIKDERSTILFQLNELSKTMNNKTSTYQDQKLDQDKFKDDAQAVETIKEMIVKFQTVEKESKATKKVFQSMNSIYERYQQYSDQINKLVKMTQKSNKEYEDGMKNMLQQKQNQIISKRQSNQDIYDNTQNMIKKIDEYENERLKLIDEEAQLEKSIEKLIKIQQQAKTEVDRFTEWAQIVIDKNHRKNFNKESKQKQAESLQLTQNNKKLQVYLKELENQEQILKIKIQEKENQVLKTKKKRTQNLSKKKNQRTFTVNQTRNPSRNKIRNVFAP